MAESVFAWLDYDDSNRRRMTELVDLFRESGTLDELGIGTIRDTLSDHFFPGTSTVQTRVKYFLFIPWIYQQLENERTNPARMNARSRELQSRLVLALKNGTKRNEPGIIGASAGEHLKRLPSSIYWNGIGQWGIRVFEGSIEQYGGSLDSYYASLKSSRQSEGGELVFESRQNWHRSLPAPPPDFLETSSFELTVDEAEFLSERIRRSCAGSLLAESLSVSRTRLTKTIFPWELDKSLISEENGLDLEHAEHFALIVQGAMLVYNLMLAEIATERQLSTGGDNVERYRIDIALWADQMLSVQNTFRAWDPVKFNSRIRTLNPRVSQGALRFFDLWATQAISAPRAVQENPVLRQLVSQRERFLKGSLARLHSPRALEQWSGSSGLGLMNFRWGLAKLMVMEILNGLHRPHPGPRNA